MRIALISDIHGHLIALEAVLADIDLESVDQIIFLGDVATLGPQPCEAIARLKTLGCPCVMGNHDAFLLNPNLIHGYTNVARVIDAVSWCRSRLAKSDFDYIQSFSPQIEIPLGDEATLLCFHVIPESNAGGILATTPPNDLDFMIAGHAATVMVAGHTRPDAAPTQRHIDREHRQCRYSF